MKFMQLLHLMYKRFKIDFSGVHTSYPNFKSNISHFMLSLYKTRMRRFWKPSLKPRYIHPFYRQFVYLYIYRVDINNPKKKQKRYKWWFISRRLARLFYLTYKYKQFYRLGQRLVSREGSWSTFLALALECRVLTFLYRFHVSPDIFELRRLTLMGIGTVDDVVPKHCNYLVPLFSMVVISAEWRRKLFNDLKLRFKRKRIFFTAPRFWMSSYKFFFSFMKRYPNYPADFAYPFLRKSSGPNGRYKKFFLIDLYRGCDISFL